MKPGRGTFLVSPRQVLLRGTVLLVGLAVLASALPAGATASSRTRTVTWQGVSVTVPATWPVRDVDGRPGCVRFDQNALYLGDPSRSTCPPHLVGRRQAVHLTRRSVQGVTGPDLVVTDRSRGVSVLVVAGNDPAAARTLARSVRVAGRRAAGRAPAGPAAGRSYAEVAAPRAAAATPSAATPPAASSATSSAASSEGATTYTGLGFDTCTAPTLSTMATWVASSPYRAANIYVGGASRSCAQPDLSADWVRKTVAQGWTLIPTYVGLQAPCSPFPNRVDPAQAPAQGAAAADDAVTQLAALGLGAGNPVYVDMEAFRYADSACLAATRAFLDAWTDQLHARGYVSGIYSSSNTMKALVVDTQGDPTFSQPDAIWFARWPRDSRTQPGDPTLRDPAIPDQYFADQQRIHQYRGGHQETWGGVTLTIDSDSLDAPVAPSRLAAEGSFVTVPGSGTVYRIAGGAALPVTDWAAVGGGPQPVQNLSQAQFDSLPDRPVEGTFLRSGATGRIWRVVRGVATYVPSWTPYGGPVPAVVVDQAALDNAGTGGIWDHLTSGRPTPAMRGPAERGTTRTLARFSWFGGYSSSAVARYDVRWRKAAYDARYGPWSRPASWQDTRVTNVPLGLRAGQTSCVAVRAHNRAGQVSAWTRQRCTARALDDPALARSRSWHAHRRADGFFGGTYLTTRSKGATLTRTGARVRRIGVVASTCRACGRVAVRLDGRRIGTVSLAGPRRTSSVFMLAPVRRQRATVTVRVLSGGQRVRIDGLVLSRS